MSSKDKGNFGYFSQDAKNLSKKTITGKPQPDSVMTRRQIEAIEEIRELGRKNTDPWLLDE
jgi:hypothetical protein